MRAARLVVIASMLLTVSVVQPPFASADATKVVRGLNGLPSNLSFGLFNRSCTTPGQPAPTGFGQLVVTKGPAPVPAGRRTWGFTSSGAGGAIGPFRSVPSMGDLATAQMQVAADTGGADGIGYADVFANAAGTTYWWGVTTSTFHVPAGNGWQTESTVDSAYSWRRFDSSGPTATTFSGTIKEMVAQIGSDHGGLVGLAVGCGSGDTFHFDKAQFGSSGDVTTYDFEGPTTQTAIHGSAAVVRAGSPVTLRGVTTESGGTPLSKATLTLQAKRFDRSSWKDVGTDTETFDTSQHPARLTKRPLLKTDYRWVFHENQVHDGSTSRAFTVKVRTAVTAKAADTTVHHGGTITVSGHVTPAKPGKTVTLYRGTRQVGTGTVNAKGGYTVSTTARSIGVWKLHVTIGASSGNLAGRSGIVKVTVG
jgi:hypothetical protein